MTRKTIPNGLTITLDIIDRTRHHAMTTQAIADALGLSHQTTYLYVNAMASRGVLEPFNGPRRNGIRKGHTPRFFRLSAKWGGKVKAPSSRVVHILGSDDE